MDITKNSPTVVAFCAGYGGIERGLDLAGVKHRVLTYVEIEAFACANLVAKMETNQLAPAPIWTDLKTFPAQIFRDKVDILTGGYPCQPFSAAGKRAGKDDPRHLWPYIRRHIESIRPVRCFFENVEGHISLGLREVIEDLESLGYATTWGVFSAAEVGAPHQRKRVYILGDSNRDRRKSDTRRGALSNKEWNGEGEEQRRNHQPAGFDRAGYVPNADSSSRRRGAVGGPQGDRESELHGSEEFVPDTCGQGLQRGEWKGATETEGQPIGYSTECSEELADSISPRSQVGLSGQKRPNQEGNAGITDNCSSKQGGREIGMSWPPEPRLGRVVDGCADRVDRIRLLGNGVVPQTAAKAWAVLNNQIQKK